MKTTGVRNTFLSYRTFLIRSIRYILILSWLIFVYVVCLVAVILTIVAHRGQAQLAEFGSSKIVLMHAIDLLKKQVELNELGAEFEYADEDCSSMIRREANEIRREADRIRRNSEFTQQLGDISMDQVAYKEKYATCIQAYKDKEDARTKKLVDVETELGKIDMDVRNIAVEMPLSRLRILRRSLDMLIFLPFSLITLLLCMAMGALGSAMHMAQELMKDPFERSLVWYLFRPFLGIMLAVATFVLFKSGQVVLTVSPSANSAITETGLNPFLVSFVAIISGMLSEQAYRKIGDTGSQLLAAKDTSVLRWCRPKVVAEALRKAGKTETDFLPFANTDEMTIKSWLAANKPVSANDQLILAAFLDVPPWELFTDQRPSLSKVGQNSTADGVNSTVSATQGYKVGDSSEHIT